MDAEITEIKDDEPTLTYTVKKRYHSFSPYAIVLCSCLFCLLFFLVYGMFYMINTKNNAPAIKRIEYFTFVPTVPPLIKTNNCVHYNVDYCVVSIFVICGLISSIVLIPFLISDRLLLYICPRRSYYDEI